MENAPSPGIGRLQSAQKSSDDETVPAGTEKEADEDQGPQPSQENSTGDEPLGEESGTMVYDGSPETSGYQEVAIQCHAHKCVFNRQGNCHASEVEIDMSSEKGQVPSATSCKTYQPATPND